MHQKRQAVSSGWPPARARYCAVLRRRGHAEPERRAHGAQRWRQPPQHAGWPSRAAACMAWCTGYEDERIQQASSKLGSRRTEAHGVIEQL
eukprot:4544356-Prymnesium_polylepis.1